MPVSNQLPTACSRIERSAPSSPVALVDEFWTAAVTKSAPTTASAMPLAM